MEFKQDDVKFKITNIVMGVFFVNIFNLRNLSELIPCIFIPNFSYKKGKSIPFFGIENCVISCNSKYELRGIRKECKIFKNSVCVDFQNETKNIHIRISNNNFHITGSKSYEMGLKASQNFILLLHKVDAIWIKFYILDLGTKQKILEKSYFLLLHKNEKDLLMFNDPEVLDRMKEIKKSDFGIYLDIIYQIILFSFDYPTVDRFYSKLQRILNLIPCKNSFFYNEDKLVLLGSKMYNGVYNYKYPFSFHLPRISKFLYEKGYIVSYDNISKPTNMEVVITVPENEITFEYTKDVTLKYKTSKKESQYKKIPTHKFNINKNGSVLQTSPTLSSIAEEKFKIIRKEIFDFVYPKPKFEEISF